MDFFIFLQYSGAFFSKINSYLYIIKTFRQHFIINLQTISGLLLSGQHRHQGPVSKKTALRGFPARQINYAKLPMKSFPGKTEFKEICLNIVKDKISRRLPGAGSCTGHGAGHGA